MKTRKTLRLQRRLRIRARIRGTAQRPRISIFRSNKALIAQIVNDEDGTTLVSRRVVGKNQEAAQELGKAIAKAAKSKRIARVVFDRGGYRYHGVVKSFAEMARQEGLQF